MQCFCNTIYLRTDDFRFIAGLVRSFCLVFSLLTQLVLVNHLTDTENLAARPVQRQRCRQRVQHEQHDQRHGKHDLCLHRIHGSRRELLLHDHQRCPRNDQRIDSQAENCENRIRLRQVFDPQKALTTQFSSTAQRIVQRNKNRDLDLRDAILNDMTKDLLIKVKKEFQKF